MAANATVWSLSIILVNTADVDGNKGKLSRSKGETRDGFGVSNHERHGRPVGIISVDCRGTVTAPPGHAWFSPPSHSEGDFGPVPQRSARVMAKAPKLSKERATEGGKNSGDAPTYRG